MFACARVNINTTKRVISFINSGLQNRWFNLLLFICNEYWLLFCCCVETVESCWFEITLGLLTATLRVTELDFKMRQRLWGKKQSKYQHWWIHGGAVKPLPKRVISSLNAAKEGSTVDLGDGQFSERCDVDGSSFNSDAIPIIFGKAYHRHSRDYFPWPSGTIIFWLFCSF